MTCQTAQTHRSDFGLGFDGDGIAAGVSDDERREILPQDALHHARDLSTTLSGKHLCADVEITACCLDPELIKKRPTGRLLEDRHSHMKRRVKELGALGWVREVEPLLSGRPIRAGLQLRGLTASG